MKKALIFGLGALLSQEAVAARSAVPLRPLRAVMKSVPAQSGTVSMNVAPQVVHTRLFRQPLTLLGQTGSSEVSIYVDPLSERRSAPHLVLPWDVSAIVDLSLSTLTVELDDVPLLSSTLQKLQSGRPLDLSLSGVSGGFHVVRVRTRLLTSTDPCRSLYDRELWLRLSPDSELTYLHAANQKKGSEHVGGILTDWQAKGGVVYVMPLAQLDRGTVGAYLQATRWLLRSGLRAEWTSNQAESDALILRIGDHEPGTGTPWESAVLGSLTRQGTQLVAAARSGDDLGHLFGELLFPGTLAQCHERLCLLGRAAPPADPPPDRTVDATASGDRIVTLAQKGHPRGYSARGGGWHLLRLNWERPSSFALTGVPELRLFVQSAALAGLDRNASSLNVRVEDRPIASYSPAMLAQEAMPLRIKLPPELWEQRSWNVEIDMNLRSIQTGPCQASVDSTLWLTLGAESGIYAQHKERRYPGTLAAVAELSQTVPTQLVFSRTLTWPAVASLSAVLASLVHSPDWQVVSSQAECGQLCVLAQVGAIPETSPLALLAVGSELHWADRHGTFHLPLLPASEGVLLDVPQPSVHSADLRHGELLWVHFPLDYSPKKLPATIDLASLPYRHALWSVQRWLPLGERSLGVTPPDEEDAAQLAPAATGKPQFHIPRQALDALWLLCSAGIVYLAIRIARRRRKPSTVMNF